MNAHDTKFRLDGRTHIVTGATGGIGRAVASAFAEAGASVLAVDLDGGAVQELVATLPGPQPHLAAGADLSDLGTHASLVERAVEELGRLDGLVHLAAVIRRKPLDQVTESDWDAQLDLNLKGSFFLNLAVARQLALGGGGTITNFTSQAWWSGGLNGSVVYAASKAGVVAMSRGLSRELAGDAIRVNTVAPGMVDTRMIRDDVTDQQLQSFVDALPLGRMADPQEIAGTTVFLASEAASYVTGATINLTGGQLMY